MTTPAAVLAAGVLDWRWQALAGADHTALVAALRDELTPASDWQRIGAARPRELEPTNGDWLTRWVAPSTTRSADDDARLAAAWEEALGPPHEAPSNFLRLEVGSLADARALQQIGLVSSRQLVGVFRTYAHKVEWRWPLRVGLLPGPRAGDWLDALQSSRFHGEQYHATMVPADSDAQFELVVLDTATLPEPGEPLAGDHAFDRVVRSAGSVVAVGEAARSTEFHDHTMMTLLERFDPAITIVMPVDDMSWWVPTFRELSHDVPLDAAVVAASPAALVAGDPLALAATAVGHWAMWVARDLGEAELSEGLDTVEFRHEDEGSQVVHDRVELLRSRGIDAVLRINLALAAAPDDAAPDEATPEAAAPVAPPAVAPPPIALPGVAPPPAPAPAPG
ncbi:MAG: hypothetical protein Q8M22_05110, partial [Actinomycetota bacterium]|nr:hypothetical protein [Actinomycetota bacterium]